MDKGSKEAEEYIREQARFYGRDPTKVLTPYQKINLAAEELAVGTPILLHTQQKHLELARTKVDDDGYLHRKGISRSKRLHNSDKGDTSECPKRVKMTESVRLERIACIEEAIKDTDKQINYKNLQREQAGNSHQYQLCENITEEIGVLKHKRYELNTELKPLKWKQQQAAHGIRQASVNSSLILRPTTCPPLPVSKNRLPQLCTQAHLHVADLQPLVQTFQVRSILHADLHLDRFLLNHSQFYLPNPSVSSDDSQALPLSLGVSHALLPGSGDS